MPLFVATIRKRGWHMFAQGMDKVDDSGKLSALTGAYADLGARKEGACVFFRVSAPFADEVILFGSFNGWGDGISLEKGDHGIWQTNIPSDMIPDGCKFKFEAKVGDATVYLSDPYAAEDDGEPYFNSVYREAAQNTLAVSQSGPLNVYGLDPDRWFCYDGCREVDYKTLSRELLPYLLQMGYTHVYIFGRLNERQGGESGFIEFVDALHSASIGVFTDEGFGLTDKSYIDGIITRVDSNECSCGLVHKISSKDGEREINILGSGAYINCFNVASADKQMRRRAAAMAYLLFKEGRMLTRMGCETGRGGIDVFDLRSFESAACASFQIFCSELAEIYLSNPEIGSGSALTESCGYGIRITARHAEELDLVLVTDHSGNGGLATLPVSGEWRVILDSSRLLGYESAVVSSYNDKSICIALPSYGAVLLERIK